LLASSCFLRLSKNKEHFSGVISFTPLLLFYNFRYYYFLWDPLHKRWDNNSWWKNNITNYISTFSRGNSWTRAKRWIFTKRYIPMDLWRI